MVMGLGILVWGLGTDPVDDGDCDRHGCTTPEVRNYGLGLGGKNCSM